MKELKIKNITEKTIILIYTIITLFSLFINIKNLFNICYPFNTGFVTILIVGILIFSFYNNFYFRNKQILSFKILSIIFSIFLVLGNSYENIGNWNLVFGSISYFLASILMLIGYYLIIYSGICTVYNFVNKIRFRKNKNKIIKFIFEDHPFISCFVIMLILWLPYIISFYPGILSPDPSNQIKQFFGIETKYTESVVLLDKNVLITNHHPYLHTLLLGGCTKIGYMLGSLNFGIFIYSIIQIIFLLSILSYTITYMKKINTPYYLRIIFLIIYSIAPVFPLYAMSTLKDVIFSGLTILYIIMLFDYINNKEPLNTKTIIKHISIMLLLMLFRNNGIYMVIMSYPFLLLLKNNRLKIFISLSISVLLFMGYSNTLLPALKITPGSVREALSIPFQQTARYVINYEDELTNHEKKVIDKILDYDTLKERYDPVKSDPVKNEFNRYATSKDLKEYFKVWFDCLLKHPGVYVEATINNVYGYFYPNTTNWYVYHNYDTRLKESGLDYHYNSFNNMRSILGNYGVIFPYIPILGMIVNIGFSTWIIFGLITFLIHMKKYKYLIYLLPVVSLILVCVASPVNTYFRYAMPYIFAMPIIVSMFINIINGGLYEKK